MPSLPPPVPRDSAPIMPPQTGAPGKDKPMAPTPETSKQLTGGDAAKAFGAFAGLGGIFMLLPLLFTIVFHLGAGYLSYQKHQSAGWAFLSFLFAVFYYPYYAFTSSSPAAPQAMYGGLRKLLGVRRR